MNVCFEAMQNFWEYYSMVWMSRPMVKLRNCHTQILSHVLARLCVRNERRLGEI